MRIVHFAEYADGGVLTYLNTILKFQTQKREVEKIIVLASKKNSGDIHISDKIEVIYYEYERSKFYRYIFKLQSMIANLNPDIVHVHSTFAGFLSRLSVKKNRKYKIIYCPHGWSFNMDISLVKKKVFSAIETVLSFNTDLIIDISDYEYATITNKKCISKKTFLINNGVENRMDYNIEHTNIVFDENKVNLLFVGRFDYQKGLDVILEYISKDKTFDNKFHLYCIGKSVINNKELKFVKGTTNIGEVKLGIDYFYKNCDIVIIPSRWEGFGLVAVEAMKNSKPILVNKVGQLNYFLKDKNYGFNLNSREEFKNSLDYVLKNKKNLKKLGEEYRKDYLEKYNSDLMNQKIFDSYLRIIGE